MPKAYARTAALALATLLVPVAAFSAEIDEDVAPQAAAANYYQRVDVAACAGGKCTATFPKVPRGKALQTTNASCVGKGPLQGAPSFATLQSGATILSVFPLSPYTSTGSDATVAGGLAGGVFIGAGKAPSIVLVGSSTTATCTLSGRLIAD